MKITLDLSKLLAQGRITPAEAEHLKKLSSGDTGALGINILVGFGVIAVSAGACALMLMSFKTTSLPVMLIGALLFALGLALTFARAAQWELLAQICIVIGALMLGGGLLYADDGSLRAALAVTAGLTVAALAARSSLLAALAVISLAGCLGARTGYLHAMYSLSIREPTLTILLFAALALGAYHLSKRLTADYERLAITVARTAVFLVNFGFWIGSLWGDRLMLLRGQADPAVGRGEVIVPAPVFSVGWALALIAVGIWGVQANRRWVVNIAAVFGAIHFYTQWFERLGASPVSVFGAGLLMLAFALVLWRFNQRQGWSAAA